MKQKILRTTLYGVLLSSLGITTGCVDDSYDLSKNIDMTVTVGGDLVTPANSSEEITLDDLLDVDYANSDLDTTSTGDYVLRVSGDPTNSTVKVNGVSVDAASSQKESVSLHFSTDMLTGEETSPKPIENLDPEWTLKNESVTEDVVDLDYADQIRNNNITLKLKPVGNASGVVLKKGLTFTFPAYLEIELPAAIQKDFSLINQSDGSVKLQLKNDYVMGTQGAQWQISLKRLYFKGHQLPSGEGFDAKNHKVLFNISIPLEGNVALRKSHFPSGVKDVNFKMVSYVSSSEMTFERVRAVVDPQINFNVSDISITDLPDFLTDNEVDADLANPRLLLRVNNTAEVDVNLNGVLQSYKDGAAIQRVVMGTDLNTTSSKSIRLKASSENLLCLSPLNENVPAGYTWVQVDELPDLIRTIPDMIKVEEIHAQVLPQFYTLNLGVNKTVSTDYNLDAPLEFGKDFNIVYKDTLDGWSEDIKNYEMKEVQITLKAINRIPLNLNMTASALDANGNVMTDVLVETEGYVAAPATGEAQSEQTITFTLKKKDGSRIKNLDGLILRLDGKAYVEGSEDANGTWTPKSLNANQTLKLDDLRLRVKGGVTLDLN